MIALLITIAWVECTSINQVAHARIRLNDEPLFLQLASQLNGHTKRDDVQDNLDELTNDAFDVMAFTENAADTDGQQEIKT